MNSADTRAELLTWHEQFAALVRARDYAAATAMFAPDCRGFGTCVEYASNREELIKNQWHLAWPATHSFFFLPEPFEVILSVDGSLACVLSIWESRGLGSDGRDFPRRGRCTIVLQRNPAVPAKWTAVHTHFSKTPGGEV